MTAAPRLTVSDLQGQRSVVVDKPVFTIGRRATADLQVAGRDVSREHARISLQNGHYVLADCGSRFGTFTNGEALVGERPLVHGDRIRLGQTDAVEIIFVCDEEGHTRFRTSASTRPDLPQMAAVLNGLRAVGSSRVLEEVLTLVLDSALEVTAADRGFVMLANAAAALEFKVGRAKGQKTLTGTSFATSDKIPREVFQTGNSRIVADLMDGSLAGAHGGTIAIGIRHVLCVPLRVSAYAATAGDRVDERVIGVLYLDGRERAAMLSPATRDSLEAFATQAALAINSARLYAEAAEKAKLDRDLRVAAEIQRALLPEPRFSAPAFDVAGASIPCRTIGGDFFDYFEVGGGTYGVALGDVAGKGPPAALLATVVQSHCSANAPLASDPADLMTRVNSALLRRAIEARFATMCYATLAPGGLFRYSNAGQEHPVIVRDGGVMEALDAGGPVLGLLPGVPYACAETSLARGDIVVMFSDGVTEARNSAGGEYERGRLLDLLKGQHGREADRVLEDLLGSVNAFAEGAPQADDITVLVLRYRGGD
jgi:sigma-B regulation protein RsbU (phosphoserine phosphatase)